MPGGLSVIGIYVFCPAEQVHDVSHHKIFYETRTETETRRVHALALHGPCMCANSLSKFLCHNVLRSIPFILFWAKYMFHPRDKRWTPAAVHEWSIFIRVCWRTHTRACMHALKGHVSYKSSAKVHAKRIVSSNLARNEYIHTYIHAYIHGFNTCVYVCMYVCT
jgi:hypothetical protein